MSRGGERKGSGRKKGSGKNIETKVISFRVPSRLAAKIYEQCSVLIGWEKNKQDPKLKST